MTICPNCGQSHTTSNSLCRECIVASTKCVLSGLELSQCIKCQENTHTIEDVLDSLNMTLKELNHKVADAIESVLNIKPIAQLEENKDDLEPGEGFQHENKRVRTLH